MFLFNVVYDLPHSMPYNWLWHIWETAFNVLYEIFNFSILSEFICRNSLLPAKARSAPPVNGEVAAARLRELQHMAARVRSGTAQEAGGNKAGGRLNADRAVAAVVCTSSFSFDAAQSITVVAVTTAAVTTASSTVGFASDRDAA